MFLYNIYFTDFLPHQTINTQSMSADIFSYKEEIYVTMAVPNSDSCIIMEWDHIETKFRPFDNITGLQGFPHGSEIKML